MKGPLRVVRLLTLCWIAAAAPCVAQERGPFDVHGSDLMRSMEPWGEGWPEGLGSASGSVRGMAQEGASPSRPIGPAILGAVLGAGTLGGVGYLLGRAGTARCQYDDCDVGGGFGFMVGTWAGSAVGAYSGARKGGATPSFGRALLGSTVGILVGGLVSVSLAHKTGGAGPDAAYAVGYAFTQAAVAGLTAASATP